jgi:hypothetical protein
MALQTRIRVGVVLDDEHDPVSSEVGRGGIEPPTLGLKVPCSTD